jgi:hypothetical protein
VKDPPLKRESIVAMINLDMIGRLKGNSVEIGGAGTAPNFAELAGGAAKAVGLEAKLTKSGFGPSDHASFYAAKIPVLFFFTGLHADYHRPSDDPETIEADGARRVARAAFACAESIANADQRPEYVAIARERRGPRNRARLGVMLERGHEGPGVALSDVVPSGAAGKAGLKAGDVILELDGGATNDARALIGALSTKKPGDVVKLTVLRGGEKRAFEVKLGGR